MGMTRTARCLAAALVCAALAAGCDTRIYEPPFDGVWHQVSAAASVPGAVWCKEDLVLFPDGTLTMQQYECGRASDVGTWKAAGQNVEIDFENLPDRSGRVVGWRMTLRAPDFPELVYLKQ